MSLLTYSIVVPVYNRPEETKELLESLAAQSFNRAFEVVIIEDGSNISSEQVVADFSQKLTIQYLQKPNTGPGDSRNVGMKMATGDYLILVDSDCVLPPDYLKQVDKALQHHYVDFFGGPDSAAASFSPIQKAINFSMTSFLTTGGIRGNKKSVSRFEPRSFNMGLSKVAFELSGGFGTIHPGEDPDLSIRLWKLGFKSRFFADAGVFHKRRISWPSFFKQVYKFGLTRPVLNEWHPEYAKITYYFPSVFLSGLVLSLLLLLVEFPYLIICYLAYFLALTASSCWEHKSLYLALLSLRAFGYQMLGYGLGFARMTWVIKVLRDKPEKHFPFLFFKT
ncbi:MAG: glycosyl transferase family 2 [Flavobacterium sp. BFFFF2]|nr:MAG: glycosyl transferase family 2 [Flavobacterium sp. BFFFF2]